MTLTRYYALITDQHVVEPNTTLYGLDTNGATKRLVESLRKESVELAGIICLGDLADTTIDRNRMTAVGGRAAYENAQDLFKGLSLPIWALAGNHDDPVLMREYFPSQWDSSHEGVSCLRCFNIDLIGVDVRTGPEPTGLASKECLQALERALEKSSRAVLLSHYPLFDLDNSRIEDDLSTINRKEVLEIVGRHSAKVLAAFHGHLHLWISTRTTTGISYGVPSSSFTFKLEPQSAAKEVVSSSPCGYYLLGVSDNGSVVVRSRFLPPAKSD